MSIEKTIKYRRVEHEGVVFHWDGKIRNGRAKVYRLYGDITKMQNIEEAIALDVAAIYLAEAQNGAPTA